MVMRWLMCGLGNMHIIGPCPGCESSRGGVILGTVGYAFRGVVTAKCVDCGKSVDYYVDAGKGQMWLLKAVDAKRGRIR